MKDELSFVSATELRRKLLSTSDVDKVVRILVEDAIRKQEEIFFLRKRFTELTEMFDKMCDTMAQIAYGTAALGKELEPILQQSRSMNRVAKTNEELSDD